MSKIWENCTVGNPFENFARKYYLWCPDFAKFVQIGNQGYKFC